VDKGKVIRLILIPVLIGLVATLLARQLMTPSQTPTTAVVEMVSVVTVAGKDPVPARTKLIDTQLVLKPLPKAALTGTEYTNVKDLVGQVTLIELAPGEVVLPSRLVTEGKGALPFRIPPGMRAETIRIDELNGVAGYPEPGDLVDLILTLPAKTPERPLATARLLYEGVPVLAKGPAPNAAGAGAAKPANENAPKITSITLALKPEAAVEVALAEQIGFIKVLLRPALKEGNTGRVITSEALYK
jgi:pilus assembly protein CpaB